MFLDRFKKKYIYSVVFVLFLSLAAFGQGFGTGTNESCDGNKVMLHGVAVLRSERMVKHPEKDPDIPLIIIAYLGIGEINQKYSLQRLKEAKDYLTLREVFPEPLVIIAQGEKVKDKGRIDFYFDGELQYRIILKRNQLLNLLKGGHCDAG